MSFWLLIDRTIKTDLIIIAASEGKANSFAFPSKQDYIGKKSFPILLIYQKIHFLSNKKLGEIRAQKNKFREKKKPQHFLCWGFSEFPKTKKTERPKAPKP